MVSREGAKVTQRRRDFASSRDLCAVARNRVLFAVCAVACVMLAAAADARAQLLPQEEPPEARHTITGTVQFERRGSPDERLEVILIASTHGGRREAFTESNGRFVFENLPAGSYSITVRAPYKSGYEDGTADVLLYNGKFSQRYTVTVTLRLSAGERPPPGFGTIVDASVPKAARDAHEKGVAASTRGDREEAVARFNEALAIAPTYGAALNDLGVELLRLERAAEAADVLRRAVAAGPDEFAPHLNLGLALLAGGDLEGAAAEVERARAIMPDSSRALCVAGQIAHRRGRLAEAVDALKRAMDRADDMQAAAAMELGRVYETAGDAASAAGAYQLVVALEPDGARGRAARERLTALGVE
jgi:Flp pilus assembly protein TadD